MRFPPGWQLPESITSRLGERSGRQRAILAQGHLLLILHRVPGPDEVEREGVFFWRLPDGEWKANDGSAGLPALSAHVNSYEETIEILEADYARAGDATAFFTILEAVTPLHRAAANLHKALQHAREALPDAREIITLRDIAGDVDRTSELLQADAKNAIDYRIARQSEEQARLANEMAHAGNRLNLLAALFLPLTAITSMFGMSLPNGLEHAPPWVSWSILAFAVLLGFVMRGVLPR